MNRKEEAKEVAIDSIMLKMGFKPHHSTSSKTWYNSPFRGESVPSFVVNKRTNKWRDWGDQEKRGDSINLVMEMEGCTFSEALDYLVGENRDKFTKHDPKDIPIEEEGIYITDVSDLKNNYLLMYAESRGINRELLKLHCKEVDFLFKKTPNIERKAIGFKNDKGGWELRNDRIKLGNSPKHWRTVLPPSEDVGSYATCDVFEGFFDFLSHLQYMGWDQPANPSFIMNSLVYSSFLLKEFDEFDTVALYLDNDAAASMYIERYFTDGKYILANKEIYPDFEDYNDFVKFKSEKQ